MAVDDIAVVSRAVRLQRMGLVVDGIPYDLRLYPYLIEMIDAMGVVPRITIRKGAQMGFTVSMVLAVIDLATYQYPRGILYLMPTRDDVHDFSRSRFDRMLKENYDVLGRRVHGTDSMAIKRIGSAFVYFRGAKSRSQLKSIPADLLVEDERDEMEQPMIELANKRLDGSAFRHEIDLSTPTIPGYGVDANYEVSDQRMYHLKCPACGHWTCFEVDFPRCLTRDKEGNAIRCCPKCSRELHAQMRLGAKAQQWVPAKPGVEHRGYYVSQLNSPTVPARVLLEGWEEAESEGGSKMREYKNSRLGLAHADIEDIMTEQLLKEITGNDPVRLSAQGPCFIGVDIGKNVHHYVLGERDGERHVTIHRYGRAGTFEELHDLCARYNVGNGVFDEMAETHMVRQFKEQHPEIYGNWYSEHQRGDYEWNDVDRKVTCNRTALLDHSHREVLQKRVTLPRPGEEWKEWVAQMGNLARITEQDEETGQQKHRWVIRGARKNDHYRHAFAYAILASTRAPIAERVRKIIVPGSSARGASWMSG